MSRVRVTVSGDRLAEKIAVPDSVWRDIGNGLAIRIAQRTRSGVDEDGQAFEAYSEGYIKRKQKDGGKSAPVNLTSPKAGRHMVDDIVSIVRIEPRLTLTIGTAEKQRLTLYHMGEGRVERRWFGLRDVDLDYAIQQIRIWWLRTTGQSVGTTSVRTTRQSFGMSGTL